MLPSPGCKCEAESDQKTYYYTTYGNHQITAIDMRKEDLDGEELLRYPVIDKFLGSFEDKCI